MKVDVGVSVAVPPNAAPLPPWPPVLDQPPHVKLLLGYYANTQRGIGLVIDRTSALKNVARVRFDGTDEVHVLDGSPAGRGRTDYFDRRRLVLQIDDVRVTVWIDKTAFDVVRMGDAEPL